MNNFIFGAIFGAVASLLIVNFIKAESPSKNPPVASAATVQQKARPDVAPPIHKMQLIGTQKLDQKINIRKPAAIAEVKTPIEIVLGESEIVMLEESMDELQKDVGLFREAAGWRIRFFTDSNMLSQMGFKNDDLIRYEQLSLFKEKLGDPYLGTRLEGIVRTLER